MARRPGSAFVIVNKLAHSRYQTFTSSKCGSGDAESKVLSAVMPKGGGSSFNSLRMMTRLQEAAYVQSLAQCAPKHRQTKQATTVTTAPVAMVAPTMFFFHERVEVIGGGEAPLETLVDWMTDFKRREVLFHPDPSALVKLETVTAAVKERKVDVSINDLPPSADDRLIALQWLQSLAADLNIERQTLQLACNVIDRILALEARHLYNPAPSNSSYSSSKATVVDRVGVEGGKEGWVICRRRFQLLVAACLWTMYKSEEDGDLRCEDFVIPSGDACTVPTMIQMEQFVCAKLNFRLHATTVDDAMTFIMQFMIHILSQYRQAFQLLSAAKDVSRAVEYCRGLPALQWPSKASNEHTRLSLVNQWIRLLSDKSTYWRVATVADLAIVDSRSLLHFPSAIAASILIDEFQIANDPTYSSNLIALTLFASGYSAHVLGSCLQWVRTLRQLAGGNKPNWQPLSLETQHLQNLSPHWSFRLQLSFPHTLSVVRAATTRRTPTSPSASASSASSSTSSASSPPAATASKFPSTAMTQASMSCAMELTQSLNHTIKHQNPISSAVMILG